MYSHDAATCNLNLGTCKNHLIKDVLMSTRNLCFKTKRGKQNVYSYKSKFYYINLKEAFKGV